MSSHANSFEEYLKLVACPKGMTPTHTKIGSKDHNVYGGSYLIGDDKLDEFYQNYIKHVFTQKQNAYMTEKQNIENGPVLVDLDLHYDTTITERQHSKNHIIDLVMLYAEKIGKLMNVTPGVEIPVFVMEKPDVNILDIKTKDGIHLIIGTKMHKAVQLMLRDMVKTELPSMWEDIPITNTWDAVLDEGITKGHCNWQMYGSKKPGHSAYKLTAIYYLSYNEEQDEWDIAEQAVGDYHLKHFKMLSAQNTEHVGFTIKNEYKEDYENMLETFGNKPVKKNVVLKKKTFKIVGGEKIGYDEITCQEELDRVISDTFEEIRPIEYELKETHEYVMILPESFWGSGSYSKWIRVGWALKNTNEKLFITWLKMSSQSKEFSYDEVPRLYEMWQKFQLKNEEGLTNRSIIYWAKNNSEKAKYDSVHQATIEYFIDQTVETSTEFDFATVLFNLFKDRFVCASIKGGIWYEYQSHKWQEIDSGSTLRLMISKNMHDIYCQKCAEAVDKLQSLDQSDQRYEYIRKRTSRFTDICVFLKKTSWKNNIMKEAQELFYDSEFIDKLDNNPHLLCFNNGIVDFKNRTFRKGQPDDYISMSTKIDYIPRYRETPKYLQLSDQIDEFINQLFPDPELRRYMWEHLASCLIGTNENQTFNIYIGSGANGKSKLVDLLSKGLGDYKGTVPLPFITQSRPGIGNTSSEIVQLKGKRLAVMQEPSKGDKINEGIMKEITGGDPIQGRALFKDMITFIPQFKLVVPTNTLFDIKSNDDGTWRRIRVCDFASKFVDNPYSDEVKFPRELYPYQYKIDKRLDTKFNDWAPVFISKLVDIGFVTKGNVVDCQHVLSASDGYRDGQDYLSEFAKDKIARTPGGKIKKTEIAEEFKAWYTINYGRAIPKAKELYDFMDKRYGNSKKGGWHNVAIVYDQDEGEPDVAEC
jgi:P4 family phage/plasmid primase-like protien